MNDIILAGEIALIKARRLPDALRRIPPKIRAKRREIARHIRASRNENAAAYPGPAGRDARLDHSSALIGSKKLRRKETWGNADGTMTPEQRRVFEFHREMRKQTRDAWRGEKIYESGVGRRFDKKPVKKARFAGGVRIPNTMTRKEFVGNANPDSVGMKSFLRGKRNLQAELLRGSRRSLRQKPKNALQRTHKEMILEGMGNRRLMLRRNLGRIKGVPIDKSLYRLSSRGGWEIENAKGGILYERIPARNPNDLSCAPRPIVEPAIIGETKSTKKLKDILARITKARVQKAYRKYDIKIADGGLAIKGEDKIGAKRWESSKMCLLANDSADAKELLRIFREIEIARPPQITPTTI